MRVKGAVIGLGALLTMGLLVACGTEAPQAILTSTVFATTTAVEPPVTVTETEQVPTTVTETSTTTVTVTSEAKAVITTKTKTVTEPPVTKTKTATVTVTETPAQVQGLVPQQPGGGSVYYENCAEARAAGAAPLYVGDPGYRSGMDGDGDGVACE